MNKTIIYLGDMMELLTVMFRTIFFYFFVILMFRLMGKREIGQLGVIDLIVSILIAELIAISIENIEDSIFLSIIPIVMLVVLEILIAYISIKSRRVRVFFDGKPSLIICNGKINYHEMVKQRYSMDNLLLELRQNSIKNIDDVEYAFLEANGKLSVFKYNFFKTKSSYPMPLILDGSIQYKALKHIGKNSSWLESILNTKNLTYKDIFYCFYKNKKLIIITKTQVQ